MTLTVRLEPELEDKLEAYCKETGTTKSDVVKQSIAAYLVTRPGQSDAFEIGRDLFGRWGSGRKNLSAERKQAFREAVRAKHARR